MPTRTQIYEEITTRIVDLMESDGLAPWDRPWRSSMPTSAAGRPYRGINVLLLLNAAWERGYKDPRWVTFNRAHEIAADAARARGEAITEIRVGKGVRQRSRFVHADGPRKGKSVGGIKAGQNKANGCGGTNVVLWKPYERDAKPDEKADKHGKVRALLMRTYYLFNVEQCDDAVREYLAISDPSERPADFDPIAEAKAIAEGWSDGPPVMHGGDRACYSPVVDTIHMPAPESFTDSAAYYSVRFHEMGHATGHHSRLGRFAPDYVHPPIHTYAEEELVAEFCAAFLSAQAGIAADTVERSAAYVKHWAQRMREDPGLVVMAAQRAQKAADLVLGTEIRSDADRDDSARAA